MITPFGLTGELAFLTGKNGGGVNGGGGRENYFSFPFHWTLSALIITRPAIIETWPRTKT